ncbi:MAG: TetR/AcrR family transcriptional regulator [Streptosporangiaceae bacterium]
MRRAEAKEANRRALLAAATALIAREGAGVRLDAIADAAGLTTGAIYSIFGSKSDLLVAVLADEISRVDPAIRGHDPALPLGAMIDQYVQAWIETYRNYPKTQAAFELQLSLSAMENQELRLRLTQLLEAELSQLAGLLENRIIDPARPSDRTSRQEGMAIAKAIKAVLTGFGLREPFTADTSGLADLARQSCLALTALAHRPSGPPAR